MYIYKKILYLPYFFYKFNNQRNDKDDRCISIKKEFQNVLPYNLDTLIWVHVLMVNCKQHGTWWALLNLYVIKRNVYMFYTFRVPVFGHSLKDNAEISTTKMNITLFPDFRLTVQETYAGYKFPKLYNL